MAPGLVVTLPQSQANTPDRDLLQQLCAPVEKLTRLDCVHRFTGGYSACRVYLAVAEFQGAPAARPWIVKLGPLTELKPEDDALALTKAQVAPEHVASKVYFLVANDTAALVLDVANYAGRPPIDLEAILARVEAPDAISAICDVIDGWIGNPN
ncbi:MAG TPA: hypothetical protein VH143_15925, partial [Kofleriaceae bacterium]|nr:hypothetical protein [Kofleriaceae bacterium]